VEGLDLSAQIPGQLAHRFHSGNNQARTITTPYHRNQLDLIEVSALGILLQHAFEAFGADDAGVVPDALTVQNREFGHVALQVTCFKGFFS
jgi:hypothetical protein